MGPVNWCIYENREEGGGGCNCNGFSGLRFVFKCHKTGGSECG